MMVSAATFSTNSRISSLGQSRGTVMAASHVRASRSTPEVGGGKREMWIKGRGKAVKQHGSLAGQRLADHVCWKLCQHR